MVIRTKTTQIITAVVAAVAMLLLPAAYTTSAQDTTTILVRDYACDTATPENPWTDCEAIWGIAYTVEADGAEVAGSPYTTVQDMGIGHGIGVEVPADATSVTLTPTGGIPDGYEPAPGFNPFSANIADLPEVGFGGESTGPGITMIYVPSELAEEPGNDDTENGAEDEGTPGGTTTLPETGTGPADIVERQGAVASILVAAVVLAMAGQLVLRGASR